MKNKKTLAFLFLVASFCFFSYAQAGERDAVISEILINGKQGEEFVEIYNFSNDDIELDHWVFCYYSSSRKDWGDCYRKKSFPEGSKVERGGYFVIGLKGYPENVSDWQAYSSSQLSNSGGAVAVFKCDPSYECYVDGFGWGSSVVFEGSAFGELISQKSFSRLYEQGHFVDSENNSDDFYISELNLYAHKPGEVADKKDVIEEENIDQSNEVEEGYCNKSIILSEIYPFAVEFVEILNNGKQSCSIANWSISDELGSESSDKHRKYFEDEFLGPGEFAVLEGSLYLNNESDEVKLYDRQGVVRQKVSYGGGDEMQSYSFIDSNWNWNSNVTKGEKNFIINQQDQIQEGAYSKKIRINEILPNPKGEENKEEYIELYNEGEEENLKGWVIKDSSKNGKYKFEEDLMFKSNALFTIYRDDFGFALNNSGSEVVSLLNPLGETISSVSYEKAKEGLSYNFTGQKWRWSRFLSPGKGNVFDKVPDGEIQIDEDIYRDMYAHFKVVDAEDDWKIIWDFGDKKRSYKAETRHKYKKKGRYKGSVKIFNGSEEVVKDFEVKVKDFPELKVRISALMPNPVGKDSENEWVEIENKSKKDINLKGWSIATGRNSEKLTNHPIAEDFEIEKGEKRKVYRDSSKFSLSNSKTRVELRYPTGKLAHRAKYDKDKIQEGTEYRKSKEGGWKWIENSSHLSPVISNQDLETTLEEEVAKESSEENDEKVLGVDTIKEEKILDPKYIGKYSRRERVKIFYELTKNPLLLEEVPEEAAVLGANIVRNEGSSYSFTKKVPEKAHFIKSFFQKNIQRINYLINIFFNKF